MRLLIIKSVTTAPNLLTLINRTKINSIERKKRFETKIIHFSLNRNCLAFVLNSLNVKIGGEKKITWLHGIVAAQISSDSVNNSEEFCEANTIMCKRLNEQQQQKINEPNEQINRNDS